MSFQPSGVPSTNRTVVAFRNVEANFSHSPGTPSWYGAVPPHQPLPLLGRPARTVCARRRSFALNVPAGRPFANTRALSAEVTVTVPVAS